VAGGWGGRIQGRSKFRAKDFSSNSNNNNNRRRRRRRRRGMRRIVREREWKKERQREEVLGSNGRKLEDLITLQNGEFSRRAFKRVGVVD
jgi:hypothetical protein